LTVTDLAIIARLVFAWGTLSARRERFDMTAPIGFTAAGVLLTHGPLTPLRITPSSEVVKVLADATLAMALLSDASRIGLHQLRADPDDRSGAAPGDHIRKGSQRYRTTTAPPQRHHLPTRPIRQAGGVTVLLSRAVVCAEQRLTSDIRRSARRTAPDSAANSDGRTGCSVRPKADWVVKHLAWTTTSFQNCDSPSWIRVNGGFRSWALPSFL
jgi:hypothetical protein